MFVTVTFRERARATRGERMDAGGRRREKVEEEKLREAHLLWRKKEKTGQTVVQERQPISPAASLIYLNNAREGRERQGSQAWKWMNYKASEIRREKSGTLARAVLVTTEGIHLPRNTDCRFSGISSLCFRFLGAHEKGEALSLHTHVYREV